MKAFTICIVSIVSSILLLPMISFSEQFDAPYLAHEKRHKDAWEKQDNQIDEKLAALEKKFGKKPNIIHILWDDMRYGAVGHRLLTDISGYEAPNLEQMARDGASFTRMYTEPSCTPTRVAAATGRLAVRSGTSAISRPRRITVGLSYCS